MGSNTYMIGFYCCATKYHRLNSLKTHHLLTHSSISQKFNQIQRWNLYLG